MKKRLNGFLPGFVSALLILTFAVPAFAAYQKQATLSYDNIKITVDGKAITPTDATGKAVEPFILEGTTYLPVRAVGNALGMSVYWDKDTSTAALTSVGSNTENDAEKTVRLLGFYKILSEGSDYLEDSFGVLSTQTGVNQITSMSNSAGLPAATAFKQNILDCKSLIEDHYSGCKDYLTPADQRLFDRYMTLYPKAIKYFDAIQQGTGLDFPEVQQDRQFSKNLTGLASDYFWTAYQAFKG